MGFLHDEPPEVRLLSEKTQNVADVDAGKEVLRPDAQARVRKGRRGLPPRQAIWPRRPRKTFYQQAIQREDGVAKDPLLRSLRPAFKTLSRIFLGVYDVVARSPSGGIQRSSANLPDRSVASGILTHHGVASLFGEIARSLGFIQLHDGVRRNA
jgi:hypothetical protein